VVFNLGHGGTVFRRTAILIAMAVAMESAKLGYGGKISLPVLDAPHLFTRKRDIMRPSALEIAAGDFAFPADHRRVAS
jgi:hypothetical protein